MFGLNFRGKMVISKALRIIMKKNQINYWIKFKTVFRLKPFLSAFLFEQNWRQILQFTPSVIRWRLSMCIFMFDFHFET